jgi:hypothetical protein
MERAVQIRRMNERKIHRSLRCFSFSAQAKRLDLWTRPELSALGVEFVDHDSEEPRPGIRAGFELVKAAPRVQKSLLHGVLGCAKIGREPASDTEQAPRVRHGNPLEFVLPRGHRRRELPLPDEVGVLQDRN